jgi:acyl dehydratase
MFMRMLVDNMPEGQGSLGSPGLDKLNWVSPVYPGYVLSVISTVIDTRLSESKPGVGIITLAYQVVNQDTKIVMTVSSKAFFRCRNT